MNRFSCDFEKSVIMAVRSVWDGCQINGCFFHLHQACWRNIVSNGLRDHYLADARLAVLLRCLPALAFVPLQHVSRVFDSLSVYLLTEFEDLADHGVSFSLGR